MMKWKWATTKYVSVSAWSNGIAANMIPDSPPMHEEDDEAADEQQRRVGTPAGRCRP